MVLTPVMTPSPDCRSTRRRVNWFPPVLKQVTQVPHDFVMLRGSSMTACRVVPIAIATDAN
jgi:hypothetical protein